MASAPTAQAANRDRSHGRGANHARPDHVIDLAGMPALLAKLVRQPAGPPAPVPESIKCEVEIARRGHAAINTMERIANMMVNQLNANLAQKSITVTVTDEAKKWILNQTLGDRSYGARPLRRALQKYIEDPLSEALIQGTFTTRPAFIEVFLEGDKLFYRPVGEENVEGVLLYSN